MAKTAVAATLPTYSEVSSAVGVIVRALPALTKKSTIALMPVGIGADAQTIKGPLNWIGRNEKKLAPVFSGTIAPPKRGRPKTVAAGT